MTDNQDRPQSNTGQRIAVALSHDGSAHSSPKVVASGRGLLAEQIVALAFEHNVKVREDADLAEMLVALDQDSAIPSAAIIAVAEILTRVYAANRDYDKLPPMAPDHGHSDPDCSVEEDT